MSNHLNRAWRPFVDIAVRADGDGRTIEGIAVPFDDPAPIREAGREFLEVFRRGSFARTINAGPERVKLLVSHNRATLAIGRAVELTEDAAGLVGRFRVSETEPGNDALTLVRDGVIDAFSIGFQPIQDRWNRDETFVERLEAKLSEVSLVNFPAYEGARITGLRSILTHYDDEPAPDVVHFDDRAGVETPHSADDGGPAAIQKQAQARFRAALRARSIL